MAETQPVRWTTYHGNCGAGGSRDVFIIGSFGNLQVPESIPQCKIELTEDDRRKLTNQGIPPEYQSDDVSIIRARVSLDNEVELFGVEISQGDLTQRYILKKLEEFFKCTKKSGGILHYCGHGKRNTGDWCFKDGFITFEDIMSLYMSCFRGRVLTVVTDCSYSGNWVKACFQYLDKQGVQPCGHSAEKNGILLKVYASCKPTEVAATTCFSVRGALNDKNTGVMAYYTTGLKLRETQHSYGVDFTKIRCKKAFDEPCALSSNYTWQKDNEAERIFIVRGKDRGRSAWHYVLLIDDEETIKIFKEKTQGDAAGKESIDVANYGQIIKSGWGDDPPNEIKDWIQKEYGNVYH